MTHRANGKTLNPNGQIRFLTALSFVTKVAKLLIISVSYSKHKGLRITLWIKLAFIGLGLVYAVTPTLLEWDAPALMKRLSALEGKPNSPENAIERSRLHFYLSKASRASEDKILISLLENGKKIAEEGLKLSPENPVLEFWWTANVGAMAAVKKNLGALKTLFDLEKKLVKFRETHADYGYGAADRVLGNMYAEAPRFFSIGSKSKAEESFLRAYQKFPRFPGNVISLASFYLHTDRKSEALKIASVLTNPSFIEGGDFGEFNIERPDWSLTAGILMRELNAEGGI